MSCLPHQSVTPPAKSGTQDTRLSSSRADIQWHWKKHLWTRHSGQGSNHRPQTDSLANLLLKSPCIYVKFIYYHASVDTGALQRDQRICWLCPYYACCMRHLRKLSMGVTTIQYFFYSHTEKSLLLKSFSFIFNQTIKELLWEMQDKVCWNTNPGYYTQLMFGNYQYLPYILAYKSRNSFLFKGVKNTPPTYTRVTFHNYSTIE